MEKPRITATYNKGGLLNFDFAIKITATDLGQVR